MREGAGVDAGEGVCVTERKGNEVKELRVSRILVILSTQRCERKQFPIFMFSVQQFATINAVFIASLCLCTGTNLLRRRIGNATE